MKTFTRTLIFLIAGVFVDHALGQTATNYPTVGELWHQPQVFVPASSTPITTSDSLLTHFHLANTSAGSISVTFTDNSTNCGGSPCQFWPAISLAANTVQEVDFGVGGILCTGGIKWSASSGSAVVGWAKGSYVRTQLAMSNPARKQAHRHGLAGIVAMFRFNKRHPAPVAEPDREYPSIGPATYP